MAGGSNIRVRWVNAQASTSLSTLDLVSSGGGTCQAAIIWATRDYTNDDGGTERATESVGFLNITGTTTADEHAIGVACEAQVSTEQADKRGSSGNCVMLLSYSGGSPILSDYAGFTTRITDGIQITANGGSNWGLDYRFKALLIFSDDDEVAVDLQEFITSGTQNVESTINLSTSFDEEPELMFFAGMDRSLDNTTADDWQLSIGVAHSTGGATPTITQFCQTYFVDDAVSSRAGSGYFYDTRCLVTGYESGAAPANVEVTDTGTESIGVTLRDAATAKRGMVLALSFKGKVKTYAKYWAYPDDGVGVDIENTDIGFTSQCYVVATSPIGDSNKNTKITANLGHGHAWGGRDDTGSEGNLGCRFKNGSNWTTRSYGSDTWVVNERLHTGSISFRAGHTAFLSNGIRLTVNNSAAAAKGVGVVAFETAPEFTESAPLASHVRRQTNPLRRM